jgi:excisionase family DNA binding protein
MEEINNTLAVTLTVEQMQSLIRTCIREELHSIEPHKEETERLYSRNEACTILKISLPTLSRYVGLGIIKGHRVGNRILISSEDITKALKDIPTRRDK